MFLITVKAVVFLTIFACIANRC